MPNNRIIFSSILLMFAIMNSTCFKRAGASINNGIIVVNDGETDLAACPEPISKISRVTIELFDWKFAGHYIINYINGEFSITEYLSSDRKPIYDVDFLLNYIDAFFITGSEKIWYSRTKRSPIVTDYPWLKFGIEYDNDKSISKKIPIGEEQYDIIYNPLFLEFYQYLCDLIIYQFSDEDYLAIISR